VSRQEDDLKAISLFSGAGGMDIGPASLGIETVFANDVLPEAAETHRLQLPETDFVLGDVKDVLSLPAADLITGG
jgi:DNA (cytosine-5)-methyltransferase 1